MQFVLTPKACKDADAKFSGTITLDLPTFDERCEMGENLAISLREVPDDIKGIRQARESVKLVAPRIKAVDIKKLKSGKEFKDLESLLVDPSCTDILTEVTLTILAGPQEGND